MAAIRALKLTPRATVALLKQAMVGTCPWLNAPNVGFAVFICFPPCSKQRRLVQDAAVKSARESLTITLNQYRAGTANYLAVVVAQATALSNERAALTILGRRQTASVTLIKALGGSWSAAQLPAR